MKSKETQERERIVAQLEQDIRYKETQERERIVAQLEQDIYKVWERVEAQILLHQMRLAELRKLGLLDYPVDNDGTEPIFVHFDEAEKLLRRE